jgi:colanic acid/amylovoran biosynthesis glycosyltransferase
MPRSPELIILASLRANVRSDGSVRITRKFLDGMDRYASLWPGRVTAILHPESSPQSGNLDDVLVEGAALNFDLRVLPFDGAELLDVLRQADVVQGGPDYLLNHVPAFCKEAGVAYVFVSEYTLKTRNQIVRANTSNPIRRARRYFWEWNQERRNRANVIASAAIQCNGVPTFEQYAPLNRNTLLFFDSRIDPGMIPQQSNLVSRIARLKQGDPIRLAFSGRLNRMKGADDLIRVAAALREMKVPFTLDICGDGEVAPLLRSQAARLGISDIVRLRGVLDFETELVPFVRDEIDLFVCCHRQGDPSCTYVETLACGVPIVGYDNEALLGLTRHCAGAWCTPMDDVKALATLIAELRAQPERLLSAATEGLAFARQHTADTSFQARVQHMIALVREQSAAVSPVLQPKFSAR